MHELIILFLLLPSTLLLIKLICLQPVFTTHLLHPNSTNSPCDTCFRFILHNRFSRHHRRFFAGEKRARMSEVEDSLRRMAIAKVFKDNVCPLLLHCNTRESDE